MPNGSERSCSPVPEPTTVSDPQHPARRPPGGEPIPGPPDRRAVSSLPPPVPSGGGGPLVPGAPVIGDPGSHSRIVHGAREGAGPGEIPARRTHHLSPLITTASQIWRVALPVALMATGDGFPAVAAVALLALGTLALGFVSWLGWTRFTFAVQGDSFVVESGIFNRKRRQVPLARIQQVDVRRNVVQRVFGLSALHVDTASSGAGAEVVLASLDERDAMEIHSLLLHRPPMPRGMTSGPPPVPLHEDWGVPPVANPPGSVAPVYPGGSPYAGGVSVWSQEETEVLPLVRLGLRDLLVAAVTGRALGVGLAAGLWLLTAFTDGIALGGRVGVAAIIFFGVILAVGAGVAVGGAVVTMVLTNNDFTMSKVGTDLHVGRGLLEQRRTTIALHRVQVVRVRDNLLRRRLGLCSVELQSAGSGSRSRWGADDQSELVSTEVLIPLLRSEQISALLNEILPIEAPLPAIEPAPIVARRRRTTRAMAASAAILAVAAGVSVAADSIAPTGISLLFVAISFVLAGMSYRGLGSGYGNDVVVTRSGALNRCTSVVPMARLQSVSVTRTPFQAHLGIATMYLDVAGGRGTPKVIDETVSRLEEIRAAALFDDSARADERRARARTRTAVLTASPTA